MFPMAKRRIGDDLRLPGEKLGGGSGWDHFPASRREQTFGLVDLAQALLSRLCHLKDIGEEVAGLSLGQCEAVVKFHESPRHTGPRGPLRTDGVPPRVAASPRSSPAQRGRARWCPACG